jgi:hypothetical protein
MNIATPSITASSVREESNPIYPIGDLDNDYIEPESPTGIDALLYDDDDDLNNVSIPSRSSSNPQQHQQQQQQQQMDSSGDNHDYLSMAQSTVRDDYNPLTASKTKLDPTTTTMLVFNYSIRSIFVIRCRSCSFLLFI